MSKNLLIVLGIFLAIVIAVFFFARSPKTVIAPPPASSSPTEFTKEVSISAKEYAFTPSSVGVGKGDNVKIIFTNDGAFPHNLTVPDLGLESKTISPGETATLEFTADQVGIFAFVCTVGSHKDLGMTGTLEVK